MTNYKQWKICRRRVARGSKVGAGSEMQQNATKGRRMQEALGANREAGWSGIGNEIPHQLKLVRSADTQGALS